MATKETLTTPTMVDRALAKAYAEDQINHKMCTDPEVIKAFCKDKGNCIQWRSDPARQLWSKPKNISRQPCATDNDCDGLTPQCLQAEDGKKYCGYDPQIPKDITGAGFCEIISKEKCEEFSKSPFICDANNQNCDLAKDARYWEWRNTEYIKCDPVNNPCPMTTSKCLESGECTCATDADCLGTAKCLDSDKTPGTKVCKGGGRCVFGNFILRHWCENPKARCTPSAKPDAKDCTEDKDCAKGEQCTLKKCVGPEDYPSECGGKSTAPQVTNVPPFKYDTSSGRCFMTQPYCDRFVTDFAVADGRKCSQDTDCESGAAAYFNRNSKCIAGKCTSDAKRCSTQSNCMADELCHEGWCTGPRSQCGDTKGGEWAGMNWIDMTMGRTAYASIVNNPAWKEIVSGDNKDGFGQAWKNWAKGFDCKNREGFAFVENLLTPLLRDIPPAIERLVDESLVYEKEIVSTTYVDKLNLYVLVWKYEADSVKPTFGFIRSELKKVYPSLLKKIKGKWYLKMKWASLRKEDIALKRIYIMASFGENISKAMIEYIMSMITPEEQEKLERLIKTHDLERFRKK